LYGVYNKENKSSDGSVRRVTNAASIMAQRYDITRRCGK